MVSNTSKIYFALFVTFLLIAINTPVNFIYWMCAALGALLILSYLLTLSIRGNMTAKRRHPETIFQGDTAAVTLTLQNESMFVKFFLLAEEYCVPFNKKAKTALKSFFIAHMRGKQSLHFSYAVPFPRRGVYALGPCVVSAGWPVSLFLREKELAQTSALYVLPRAVPLGDFYFSGTGRRVHDDAESASLSRTGINIYGTREYRPGDNLSHIHWKSTAKKQTFIMKEFEGTGSSVPMILLDLQAGSDAIDDDGGSAFETAVTLCASLAELFFTKRQSFYFIAEGSRRFFRYVDTDPAVYHNLLKDLAQAECDGNADFSDVLNAETSRTGDTISPVLISCSPRFWRQGLSHCVDLSRRNIKPCAMVMDSDSFTETPLPQEKASLFYETFLELRQGGFQSYYISKYTPFHQALSGEIHGQ